MIRGRSRKKARHTGFPQTFLILLSFCLSLDSMHLSALSLVLSSTFLSFAGYPLLSIPPVFSRGLSLLYCSSMNHIQNIPRHSASSTSSSPFCRTGRFGRERGKEYNTLLFALRAKLIKSNEGIYAVELFFWSKTPCLGRERTTTSVPSFACGCDGQDSPPQSHEFSVSGISGSL